MNNELTNQGVKATPPGWFSGDTKNINRIVLKTINNIGTENMIMIIFPNLRNFVSFRKNNPKKKKNNHPG